MYNKIQWLLYQYTANPFIYNNFIMQLTLTILGLSIFFLKKMVENLTSTINFYNSKVSLILLVISGNAICS